MSLVATSPHLKEALESIHQASAQFSNPDPQIRAKGEATFLALRQSEGALEYACFTLEHSSDPFALFQSLNAVLFVLPSLALDQPTSTIATLASLRDFLLHFCVTKSEQAARAGTQAQQTALWPQYLRSRSFQCALAVEKRVLGLELAQHVGQSADNSGLEHVVHQHVGLLNTQLSSLLAFPAAWPAETTESAVLQARISTGLGLVRAVVDEFVLTVANDLTETSASDQKQAAASSKSASLGSPVGLNLLQHRQCKALIQDNVLAGLMAAVFQLLYNTISNQDSTALGPHRISLFSQAASATEKLLSWTFTRFNPFSAFAWQQQNQSAADDAALAFSEDEEDYEPQPQSSTVSGKASLQTKSIPDQFVDVLISDDVVSLLSAAYRFGISSLTSPDATRDIYFSVHRLRQCILSACSFAPQITKTQHVPRMIGRTKHLCATLASLVEDECKAPSPILSARGNSLLFLAQAHHVLVSVVPLQILANASCTAGTTDGTFSFISSLCNLSNSIFGLAFHRSGHTDEEDDVDVLSEDNVDVLLGCWQALTSAARQEVSHTDQSVQLLAQAMFGSVRHQVFGPYVTGRIKAAASLGSNDDDVSELEETAGKDRDVYSDQLIIIANLGRTSANDNLRALADLAQPLCNKLTAKAQGRANFSDEEMGQTWEQVHWLVLIAGHLLADDAKGETPEIPVEIASSSEQPDPAVVLIMELGLQLLEQLSTHGSASAQATSPQVTETLLWFIGRWTSSYLLIDEQSGFTTNAAVQQAFGGDAGRQTLVVLLQRLSENLHLWMTDSDVLTQIAQVLSAFTRSSGIMVCLLQLVEMEHLVSSIVSGLDHLPANTHGILVASVVSCIYSGATHTNSSNEQSAESYFKQITASIEARFGSLLSRPDFAAISQRSDVILAIETSLDMLEGLAASIQPNSAEIVYVFLSKFFPAFAQLCRTYDSRPEIAVAVLQTLHTLSKSLELDFGAESFIVMGLNSGVWDVCHALQGETHAGKRKTHLLLVSEAGSPLEDETPFEGLSLLIELLYELTGSARAGVDDGGSDDSPSFQQSKTSDVCLFGLQHVLGLIDVDSLSVPRVRQAFGKLVSAIFAQFSGRMILLSSHDGALLEKSIQALGLCIQMDEVTARMGLDSVLAFATVVGQHFSPPSGVLVSTLHLCLATVLRAILAEPMGSSLFGPSLHALHLLLQVCRSTDLNAALTQAVVGVRNEAAFRSAAHELVESAFSPQFVNHQQAWTQQTKPLLARWRGQIQVR